MGNRWKLAAGAAAMLIGVTAASAQSVEQVAAVQARLKQDGVTISDELGMLGRSTRAAMEAYAAEAGIAANLNDISRHMHQTRGELPKRDDVVQWIDAAVRERMRDPVSALVEVEDVYGADIFLTGCGRVNAMNLYGTYTGWQRFKVSMAEVAPGSMLTFYVDVGGSTTGFACLVGVR